MDVVRIAALGIMVSLLTVLVKQKEGGIGVVLTIAASVYLLILISGKVSAVLQTISEELEILEGYQEYLVILVKAVIITLLAEFSAAICRENGLGAMSELIRVFGKVTVLFMGMPILLALISIIGAFTV